MPYSLFPSQEQYLARLGDKPYIFAEAGSGKTAMALTRASRRGFAKVIVICPASVRDTEVWEKDMVKFGLHFDSLEVQSHAWLQKKRDWSMYADHTVVIDEAHKIGNSQSKQGQGAFALCKTAKDFVLLSGTPMSKWADAVNYAKLTDFVKHKTEFYRRFVIEQPSFAHKGKDIVGYRDTDKLNAWWSSIAERAYTSEFVELPAQQMLGIDIKIKRKGYVDLIKTRMRDGEPLDSAPKLNWALRQYAETAPEKLQWAVEKIEGLPNCLVFVNTIAAMDTLSDKLTKAGIEHGVWSGKRKDDYNKHNVMILQYQAGGTGLNLQKFNNTIFLSPCYSFIDYTQAVARTHRTGQTRHCTFYHLRAEKTIDVAIWNALKEKKDFDDKLNVEEA